MRSSCAKTCSHEDDRATELARILERRGALPRNFSGARSFRAISNVIHMKSQESMPVATASPAIPIPKICEGLSDLFREHHRRILIAAYRITGNMADAEDVTQSVFLRLASGSFTVPSNVGSYLYRAAINGSLDLLRKQKTAALEPLELGAGSEMTGPGSSPETDLSAAELRAILRLAISELTPRAAEIFTLRYLEDFDNGEISALTGSSRALVAVTLYQARSRLKKRLSELDRGKK
jgi:RNA polymerase sigma factor (sigma-70 family)